MSHVATIKVAIKSLEALKRACERLGLELRTGQKTYGWFGSWVNDYHGDDAAYKSGINPRDYGKCEHAIRDPHSDHKYEVGLVTNPEGEGFLAIVDFYGMGNKAHICNKVGERCEVLVQEYAAQVAEMEAAELIAQGWQVQRRTRPNGDVQVVLSDGRDDGPW